MQRPRLVCLVGPTASGKTRLGVELAQRLGAEIVSADSRQVHRELDIGTAKPTPEERRMARHHCLDLIPPDERFDVARFRTHALAAVADIRRRGRHVLVVGGTGLYVRALLYGLCPAPPRHPPLRAALVSMAERRGTAALHRGLVHVDPAAAARIHPHDTVRIVRALEVSMASGRRLSEWQARHAFGDAPFETLIVGLMVPTPTLDARIVRRIDAMLAAGWLDEVRRLASRRYGDDAPVWRTLGYAEMRRVVEGRAGLDEATQATALATRRYAKRQRTWFRHESQVVWRDPERDAARIADDVAAFLGGARIAKAQGPE